MVRLFSAVRWKNCFSLMLSLRSGIRQGGILFPFLFNIYADSLITIMRSSDLGCDIGECYVGCITYADDLIFLSGSLTQLQKMLQLCEKQAQELDLTFNSKKSMLQGESLIKDCAAVKQGHAALAKIGEIDMREKEARYHESCRRMEVD